MAKKKFSPRVAHRGVRIWTSSTFFRKGHLKQKYFELFQQNETFLRRITIL